MADKLDSLRADLLALLTSENAHATFDATVKDLPADLRGKRPKGAPHSPWELLEHLRIAQAPLWCHHQPWAEATGSRPGPARSTAQKRPRNSLFI